LRSDLFPAEGRVVCGKKSEAIGAFGKGFDNGVKVEVVTVSTGRARAKYTTARLMSRWHGKNIGQDSRSTTSNASHPD
jgi:hypothetical protein